MIEAINAGEQPKFTDSADAMVHAVARELLATGTLGDDIFTTAESTLSYQRLADVVGVIGHFYYDCADGKCCWRRTAGGRAVVFKALNAEFPRKPTAHTKSIQGRSFTFDVRRKSD